MTKREFYALVMTLGNADATAFAQEEIEKMDVRNEKRRSAEKKESKTAVANREFYGKLAEFCAEPHTASEIGAHLEISPQKASAIMKQAVREEKATSTDVKIKGRAVKSYTWL